MVYTGSAHNLVYTTSNQATTSLGSICGAKEDDGVFCDCPERTNIPERPTSIPFPCTIISCGTGFSSATTLPLLTPAPTYAFHIWLDLLRKYTFETETNQSSVTRLHPYRNTWNRRFTLTDSIPLRRSSITSQHLSRLLDDGATQGCRKGFYHLVMVIIVGLILSSLASNG